MPRKVSNGNGVLIKLLRNYENMFLSRKYPKIDMNLINNNQNCFTTVEDTSNFDEYSSFIKLNKNKEEKKENITMFSNISEDHSKTASPIYTIKNSNVNLIQLNEKNTPKLSSQLNRQLSNLKSNIEINENYNDEMNQFSKTYSIQNHPNKERVLSSETGNSIDGRKKIISTTVDREIYKSIRLNKDGTNSRSLAQIGSNTFKQSEKISSGSQGQSSFNIFNNHPLRGSKVNLHFHKEIILGIETSLSEKYESLMFIRFYAGINKTMEVQNIIKTIIEGLSLDNEVNLIIFSDICNLILVNQYFELVPYLEMTLKILNENKKGKFCSVVEKEIRNTIQILKAIHDTFKRTIIISNNNQQGSVDPGSMCDDGKGTKVISEKLKEKKSLKTFKTPNNIPKIKHVDQYFGNNSHSSYQTFDELDENVNDPPAIDVPQVCQGDTELFPDLSQTVNESCNIMDSSKSLIRIIVDKSSPEKAVMKQQLITSPTSPNKKKINSLLLKRKSSDLSI